MSLALPDRQQRSRAPEAPSDPRVAGWLFVLVTVCFLIVQEGAITGYDGRTMYGVTEAVIERGTLAVDPELNTLPGRDGEEYSRYGLGLSLLAAVPYLLVRPLAALAPDPDAVLEAAVSASMAFVLGALAAALYLLGRRLGAGVRAATIVGIGAVAGTFALPYGKEFFSEPLAALCLVVGVERLLARRPEWAGLALGLAVVTRPQNLLFLPVVAAVVWRSQGAERVLRLGPRAGAWDRPGPRIQRGSLRLPLELGYQDVGLTTPFLTGAVGLLAHPLKSIVLFAPIVLVLPAAVHQDLAHQSPGRGADRQPGCDHVRAHRDLVRVARRVELGPPPAAARGRARRGDGRTVDDDASPDRDRRRPVRGGLPGLTAGGDGLDADAAARDPTRAPVGALPRHPAAGQPVDRPADTS